MKIIFSAVFAIIFIGLFRHFLWRHIWIRSLQPIWGGRLEIDFGYVPSNTNKYERRDVRLEKVLRSKSGGTYFYGFCHARQANRHFSLGRISSAIYDKSVRTSYSVWEFLSLLESGVGSASFLSGVPNEGTALLQDYQRMYAKRLNTERKKLCKALRSRRFALRKAEKTALTLSRKKV